MSLGFGLEIGVRGLIAHDAGVGRDGAGVSGLPLADRLGVPAAAVTGRSARIGDGESVYADGVVSHVNVVAAALGVSVGQKAADATHAMLAAPRGAPSPEPIVDRRSRVVLETADGRVVLVNSMLFARPDNRNEVMCAGSHGGRVNMARARARASTACRCSTRRTWRRPPWTRCARASATRPGRGPTG